MLEAPKGKESMMVFPDSMTRFEYMRKKAATNEMKGKFGGDCNVTQCQKSGACSYNHAMRAYYCEKCATEINKASFEQHGVGLCDVMEDHSHLDENIQENEKQKREKPKTIKRKRISSLQPFKRIDGKVGRNEKCPCGSTLKYKKCCMLN